MAEKPLRVLLCTPLPPPYGGVATWSTEILASDLARQFELRVTDIAPRSAGDQRSRFRWDRAVDSTGVLGRFVAELIRFRPDIVHCSTSFRWGLVRDLPMALLAKSFGAKSILHTHGGDFHLFLVSLPPPVLSLVIPCLRRLDRVVVLTYEVKQALEERYGLTNVVRVPNFVNTQRFSKSSSDRTTDSVVGRSLRAIFLGWIIEAKGVFDLIRAVARVPGWSVVLVGPHPADDTVVQLNELARRLGVADRVTISPPVAGERIPELLKTADFFVLPSHREGFPFSMLEAMAAGLPVVATDVGAIREIIHHQVTGLLVQSRNDETLAAAIESLIHNPQLRDRMAENGLRLVRTEYDSQVVTMSIASMYHDLVRWNREAKS